MKIRTEEFKKSPERRILIAMIVDTTVLGRIANKWEQDLFENKWASIVASWCIKFYNKYGKAPKRSIEGLFQRWAEDQQDEASIKVIEALLSEVSGEYEKLAKDSNSEYIVDLAIEHFNKVRVEKLIQAMQGEMDSGEVDKAYKLASEFGRIESGVQRMVDFSQQAVIEAAFENNKREPLVKYSGALGTFFGPSLERDGFVVFMGPEKRGKTWWLIDVAWRAMTQGRKVAFFEVGDMSQDQLLRRFMVRAAGRPLKAGKLTIPKYLEPSEPKKLPEIDPDEREYKHPLDGKRAWAACQKILQASKNKPLLKLWCYPNSTCSMKTIQAELLQNERLGWIPDVVVIDYADILAPLPGYTESRDQINATWKSMRGLSQSLHCLLVTATQSNAASYDAALLGMSNFSEDKRKFAHVTGMVGLNQSKDEKKQGLMRLNWLAGREFEYEEDKPVYVAGCLALANPAMRSTF